MKINLPKLHKGQKTVMQAQHRYRAVVCPRRWGKTTLAYIEAMKVALGKPGSHIAYFNNLHTGSRRIYDQFLLMLRPIMAENKDFIKGNRTILDIRFANDSIITFYSYENPSGVLGSGNDFIIMDECQTLNDESIFYNLISPTTFDRGGRVLFLGTPRIKGSFFHNCYLKGYDPQEVDYFTYQGSFIENTFIKNVQEEFEKARREMPDKSFRTEMLAEFAELEGTVFENFAACIKGELESPNPYKSYGIGFDIAKVHDYSVICVLDDRNHLVHYRRWRAKPISEGLNILASVCENYSNYSLLYDATGMGQTLDEQLRDRGIYGEPFNINQHTKAELVRTLQIGTEQEKVSYPKIEELLHEFETYGYSVKASGVISYGAVGKNHDDFITALMLAYYHNQSAKGYYRAA